MLAKLTLTTNIRIGKIVTVHGYEGKREGRPGEAVRFSDWGAGMAEYRAA